jgi:DnaD/phage-associated family protein
MRTFSGFPAGRLPTVRLPEAVFSEIVPAIDDLAELKVTLHVLWKLSRSQGRVRYLRRSDLETDEMLLAGLGEDPQARLAGALARSMARGVLLEAKDHADGGAFLLFANTPKGRAAVAALERGEWPAELEPAGRPNIYTLYEQNIGVLTPLLSDELRDAEATYPAEWVEEAFREAVALNKRSWRYIRAILERWQAEGRGTDQGGPESERSRRRYIEGDYADYIEH